MKYINTFFLHHRSIKQQISSFLLVLLLVTFNYGCESDLGFSSDEAVQGGSDTGIAGSYARFMVIGNFLYTLDAETITTFNLDNPAEPNQIDQQSIGEGGIESIFSLDNRLFIGSSTGLYLYELDENGIPESQGVFSYDVFEFNGCDPVVANDSLAYVTLNTTAAGPCGGFNQVNQLNIFDVKDFENPQLLMIYDMFNPKGVGLDGNTLFVCDDTQGLKIYDVSDTYNIQLLRHFSDITTYDVIPLGGLLLVVGPDNLYQFDYSNLEEIRMVSNISVN